MSKQLTSNMETALAQTKGNEPIIILRVSWGLGQDIYYASKTFSVGIINCLGKILKIGNLTIVKHQDNYGAIGQLTVEMDDSDLHFFNIMNQTALEGKQCVVYQFFPTDSTELLVLFTGSLVGPIKWIEGQRTLSFSVFTNYNDQAVGTTITSQDELDDTGFLTVLNKDSIGKMIPLVFGNCLKTKALKIFQARFNQILDNLEFDDKENNINFLSGAGYQQQTITVEDGEDWPQNQDILVDINEIRMLGSMNGNQFTIKDSNIVTDLESALCYRNISDIDWIQPNIVWINTNVKLVNKWVFISDTTNNYINYCVSQNGQKCTFQNPFLRRYPDYDQPNWPDGLGPLIVLIDGGTAISCATKLNYQWPDENGWMYQSLEDYTLPSGSEMVAVSDEIFYLNDLDSSDIKGLWAYRDIPNEILNPETGEYEQKGSKRILCPIPDSYFIIDYSSPTNAIFSRKLSSYANEFWDDNEIWVTQSSPIGPNTVDILEWILENFTTLLIDNTSFDYVRSKLINYPSNFALIESKKAIELCREIAWQARCALTIYNNFVYITYLSETPIPAQTIQPSNIQFKSLELTFSDTERMFTRAKAKYTIPTLVDDIKSKRARESLQIYQNNINIYGLKEVTWDFYIYDNPDYVNKSLKFWGYYFSNSWKKVQLKGFLNSLNLDLFDCIQFIFTRTYPLGTTGCRGIIEEWSYNPATFLIDMVIWTPLRAGLVVEDTTVWPSDNDGIVAVDPTDGLELFDYEIPVNSHIKKLKSGWASVLSVDDEVDISGNPTGEKTLTITPLPNGPENNSEITPTTQVRQIDPDAPSFIVGDIVKTGFIADKEYITYALKNTVEFQILENHNDYLLCQVPNVANSHTTVAKPYQLRRTPFDGHTINGISYTYLDIDDRNADNGTDPVEEQLVTPDFNPGDIITAIRNTRFEPIQDDDGNDILWLATGNGRVWARLVS